MSFNTIAAIFVFISCISICRSDIINDEFAEWSSRGNDEDLWRFVTRPDLTPPKLDVTVHKAEKVAPGYLFAGPYDCLDCGRRATTSYVTQQIGPTIYTQDGELVWSGSETFPDRKIFDFRPVMIDGTYHLALVTPQDAEWHVFWEGAGIIMNSSYDIVNIITSTDLGHRIDLHEFNIIEEGERALMTSKSPRKDLIRDDIAWKGEVMEIFFDEVDMRSHEILFHWRASDHVDLLESSNPWPDAESEQHHWDWFHLNSIDKDMNGDYLVSARACNTIFLISAKDGSVIWRLGGKKSDFEQDFVFSRQHHARIRKQTPKKMTITFFDNAADDSGLWEPTAESSSLIIVDLDFTTMTAKANHRHPRPDGGHSLAKGNVEYLPNGNVFGGWGENAYFSEYSKPGGELVYEGSFATHRFANYRIYKSEFVGRPNTKPDVKAFAAVNSRGQPTTVIYASWNGATEVKSWNFYAHTSRSDVQSTLSLGNTTKAGFETSYVASGYHPIVYAEAVDMFGEILGRSTLVVADLPLGFHDPAAPFYSRRPENDSNLTLYTAIAFFGGVTFTIMWNRFQTGRLSVARTVRPAWARKGR